MKKRIIIFDKNTTKMNLMCDVFMDLLDTSIEKIHRTPNEAVIETGTHKLIFKHFNEDKDIFESQLRGMKADLVINNTLNESIDIHALLSMTKSSVYDKRMKS
jgi:hypothetical protein